MFSVGDCPPTLEVPEMQGQEPYSGKFLLVISMELGALVATGRDRIPNPDKLIYVIYSDKV